MVDKENTFITATDAEPRGDSQWIKPGEVSSDNELMQQQTTMERRGDTKEVSSDDEEPISSEEGDGQE